MNDVETLNLPQVVSREAWRAARIELLNAEKELTRARDALNAQRRRLPMVEVEKAYRFDGPAGEASLLDLFEGRHQLLVYHFMFDPAWDAGCKSCSAGVDEIARGHLNHLHARGTTYALVSRAPLAKLEAFRERMGWMMPWYSSYRSDFNYDFHVTLDASVAPPEYNYRPLDEAEAAATASAEGGNPGEAPGLSSFLRVGERVFHTYSTYARGLEQQGGSTHLLDLTALGRQEDWEEPEGRATGLGAQAGSEKLLYPDEYEARRERHDQYGNDAASAGSPAKEAPR